MKLSLWFFSPRNGIYGVGVEVGGALGGPRGRGCAPPPSWIGCGTPGLDSFANIFIFSKSYLHGFSGHSENFCFLYIKQHHGSSAENSVSRVSFIQIMQVRVQNKGKSVWKSRYVGDVSTSPSLNLCLSTSNSVDKLKVIKKYFYKLCLLLLL